VRANYRTDWYNASWRNNPRSNHDLAGLEAACWFFAIGLSLTVLLCAHGYAENIGQALAVSG
jgi:hypothetical protein